MPKQENFYVKIARERLMGAKPVEFALDKPSKVKQVKFQSVYSTHVIKFRFVKYDKEINAVKFSFTYDVPGPVSKGTRTIRVWTLGSDSFPIDQFINVKAVIDQENNAFRLTFTPNPNA